jgi:hypothetical protein
MSSRLYRAVEILEAINAYFQEGADCIYRGSLILADDATLYKAISECLGQDSAYDNPNRSTHTIENKQIKPDTLKKKTERLHREAYEERLRKLRELEEENKL